MQIIALNLYSVLLFRPAQFETRLFNQPHFIAEFSLTNIIMLKWNYYNIPSPSTSASLPSDRLLWTRCMIECTICKLNWVNWWLETCCNLLLSQKRNILNLMFSRTIINVTSISISEVSIGVILKNYSSSPDGLWVNSPWVRKPNGLLIQMPWGREE